MPGNQWRGGYQENRTANDRDQAVEVTDVEKAIDHRLDEKASEKQRSRTNFGGKRKSASSTREARARTSASDDTAATKEVADETANRKEHDYAAAPSEAKDPSERGASLDEYNSDIDEMQSRIDDRESRRRQRDDDDADPRPSADTSAGGSSESQEADDEREEAIQHLLSLATYLEAQARSLLIESFKLGSPERLLLQADANVQTARLAEWGEDFPPWMEGLRHSLGHDSILDRVKKYRITYARVLVNGSKVLRLEGERAKAWERRRVVLMGEGGAKKEEGEEGEKDLDSDPEREKRKARAAAILNEDLGL